MSIRYKLFAAFSVIIALACGLAFYGVRGISNSGDLVVRLYDGPLMAINHARSAHAALNEARLLMQRSLSASGSDEAAWPNLKNCSPTSRKIEGGSDARPTTRTSPRPWRGPKRNFVTGRKPV